MIIAAVCFDIAAFSCDTFRLSSTSSPYGAGYDDDYDDFFNWTRRLASSDDALYGYWGFKFDSGCVSYDDLWEWLVDKDEVLDAPLKVGRILGVVGAVLGGLALIVLLTASCVVFPQGVLVALGSVVGILMAFFSIALCAGMFTEDCTLWWEYSSSTDAYYCIPNWKGYLIGVAFVFWIAATIPLCCCMKPRRSQVYTSSVTPVPNRRQVSFADGEEGSSYSSKESTSSSEEEASSAASRTERVEFVELPDGSEQKITTTTLPDGSCRIEKTVEYLGNTDMDSK